MITEGNFQLTGLKQNDITPEIIRIIDEAEEYLIICGYGFTRATNPASVLWEVVHSTVPNKHCIIPISLFKGKDTNRSLILYLISQGVSVSLELTNHSKWIMSEKEIYYGSANFTMDSLSRKIEVVSFRKFIANDPIKEEFISFTEMSIQRMKNHTQRRKIWGLIRLNRILANSTRSKILRLNPSIEKVVTTLDSLNEVRHRVYNVVENCFWFLDDNQYRDVTKVAYHIDYLIKNINFRGSILLDDENQEKPSQRHIFYYNQQCDRFQNNIIELGQVSTQTLKTVTDIPDFSENNLDLSTQILNRIK